MLTSNARVFHVKIRGTHPAVAFVPTPSATSKVDLIQNRADHVESVTKEQLSLCMYIARLDEKFKTTDLFEIVYL